MQTRAQKLNIQVSEFESFSWPVKVRVRAHPHLRAPRLSPTFPASISFGPESRKLVRTLGLPPHRTTRRVSNWLDWSRGSTDLRRNNEAVELAALTKG
jgi:hypothetical protein